MIIANDWLGTIGVLWFGVLLGLFGFTVKKLQDRAERKEREASARGKAPA